MSNAVWRLCSDFMDMLRCLINCRVIIISQLTVALMLQCCVRLSSVICTECIVAKRCVLEQKLLLTMSHAFLYIGSLSAYRNWYQVVKKFRRCSAVLTLYLSVTDEWTDTTTDCRSYSYALYGAVKTVNIKEGWLDLYFLFPWLW